jgi:hypothetical protein
MLMGISKAMVHTLLLISDLTQMEIHITTLVLGDKNIYTPSK